MFSSFFLFRYEKNDNYFRMNLVSKPTENQFNSRGKNPIKIVISRQNNYDLFFSPFEISGQDVLPLTFRLFPQRSDSVDNRASPSNNGLQRVCDSS